MNRTRKQVRVSLAASALSLMLAVAVSADQRGGRQAGPPAPAPGAAGQTPGAPDNYVVGVGDVLLISVYGEPNAGGEVAVRPDGKITLGLVNEIDAAGLTTEDLRARLTKAFAAFFKQEPAVTITLRQINSRMVFVQGAVGKPGPYPLLQPLTVSMVLSLAGGLNEFAKKSEVLIVRHSQRNPDGSPTSIKFNYSDFERGRKEGLKQDIYLRPGDVIIVPEG